MYKFSKVNKLTKEKHFMYFKNDHFKRNQMYSFTYLRKDMIKIKRNNKKKEKEEKEEKEPQGSNDPNLSDGENS